MLQMCGPTGIGFLYGKSELLFAMPPFLGKPFAFQTYELRRLPMIILESSTHFLGGFFIFPCFFEIPGGGEMISDVYLDHSTYAEPPSRLVVFMA